ncbi:MAG: hypothetical protein ACLQAH_05230 [Limisphaerales bacterium]
MPEHDIDEDWDRDDAKEVSGPSPEGVLEFWAKTVKELKSGKVCFCTGHEAGRATNEQDFTAAISLLEDCSALVCAEPFRSKGEVLRLVTRCHRRLPIKVQGGSITGLNLVDTIPVEDVPDLDRNGLFVVSAIPWLTPEQEPAADRFWGVYAEMKVAMRPRRVRRRIHLLHIGIGGLAAALYFFQPHQIQVSKVIGTI